MDEKAIEEENENGKEDENEDEDTNKENEEEIKRLTAKLEELKKKRNLKPSLLNYDKTSLLRKEENESDEEFAIRILPPAPTEKEKYQHVEVDYIKFLIMTSSFSQYLGN